MGAAHGSDQGVGCLTNRLCIAAAEFRLMRLQAWLLRLQLPRWLSRWLAKLLQLLLVSLHVLLALRKPLLCLLGPRLLRCTCNSPAGGRPR